MNMAAERAKNPTDDIVTQLIEADIDGEKLSFGDVVSNAMLLVQAGLETTASAMSFAYHYLATNPTERDRLIDEPDLLARAVEEFLDDYNRLLNAYEDQCPKPWIMVGHSMGGKASMWLALTHPGLVRRLAVLDIAPVAYRHSQAELIDAMEQANFTASKTRSQADMALSEFV